MIAQTEHVCRRMAPEPVHDVDQVLDLLRDAVRQWPDAPCSCASCWDQWVTRARVVLVRLTGKEE